MTAPTNPIQIPEFRRFWLARFFTTFGTHGMIVILGYQLYDIARSEYHMSVPAAAFQLGILGLVQFIPVFFLAPIAGLAADRFERRKVAGLATLADCCVTIALAVTTYAGWLNLPLLFTLAALHSTVRVFVSPALSTFAVHIVPEPLLPNAIAMGSMAWQSGSIIGPGVAGFLYASGHDLPYWFSAALLIAVSILIFSLRRLPPPEESKDEHPFEQIREGFVFVRKQRLLLGCVTLDLFAVLLGGATALLPVFARDILFLNGQPVGASGLGFLRAAPAIGAVVVGGILAWRPITQNVGVRMLLAVAVFGVATIAFGLSTNFYLSLVLLAILGGADNISVNIRSTLEQLFVPDHMRGRVVAISGLAVSASNELGEMQSGLAAAALGATGAVLFGGAGALVVTLLWAWLFPEIRNARTFASQYQQELKP